MSTEQQNDNTATVTKSATPAQAETTERRDSLSDEIVARLCHIIKRSDFDGYGFNLHSEKGKPGQYIGKVDSNSPAEHSGMREGDRILEVNGVNIGSEAHKQVVQRIKAMANEVRLLVVDNGVEVTKNNEILNKYVIRQQSSSSPNKNNINNNPENDMSVNNCDNNNVNNNTSIPSSPSNSIKSDIINNNNHNNNNNNNTIRGDETTGVQSNGQPKHTTAGMDGPDSKTSATAHNPPIIPVAKSVSPNLGIKSNQPSVAATAPIPQQSADLPNLSSLNLKMSAAEMRSRLKKKYDPKRDTVDLKSKYDIIQKL